MPGAAPFGFKGAGFVLRHHTRMIANQDGSVYSTRCSAAYAVYREDQWRVPQVCILNLGLGCSDLA